MTSLKRPSRLSFLTLCHAAAPNLCAQQEDTLRSPLDQAILKPIQAQEDERVTMGDDFLKATRERLGLDKRAAGTLPFPMEVTVPPIEVNLTSNQTQSFSLSVIGSINSGVIWEILEGENGGSITANGHYTAPGVPGTFHVLATSVADGNRTAQIEIKVSTP